MTWAEVEAYQARSDAVILPIGSTEQHGPVGLIGTDAICAEAVALRAAEAAGAVVLPTLAYTPAPFNMAFPGTVSVSARVFSALVGEISVALAAQGFGRLYVLNGHGANLAPLAEVAAAAPLRMRVRSWWEFPETALLRRSLYGSWEGMHATPSEVAITQAISRRIEGNDLPAPEPLDAAYLATHSGDRHGPPDEHRARFPDGRVGSWSELARPEHGRDLLALAASETAADYLAFSAEA